MALTDQPYIPFYVDDWMSNVNLMDCEMESHGLMIAIMCLMHKSAKYGTLSVKDKYRKNPRKSDQDVPEIIKMFATQLENRTSFKFEKIIPVLSELIDEEVLKLNGDILVCNRMVKDAKKSASRAKSGGKGGRNTQKRIKKDALDFALAKNDQNHVNGIVNENVNVIKDKKKVSDKKPTYAERAASYVIMFCKLTGKKLNPHARSNQDLIIPILKLGYTKDDIFTVMSYKYHEWNKDPDNKKYIRISTLFAPNNFKKYLSDAEAVNHKYKMK